MPEGNPPSNAVAVAKRIAAALESAGQEYALGGPIHEEARKKSGKKRRGKRPKRCRTSKAKRMQVRTVVATMENSDVFGWQVAAEVHRRGLDRAARKGCICDGQAYNWSIYEMHLLPAGFVAILDFLHLLAYLYDAVHAYRGADAAQGWKTYEQWLRLAWSGKVGGLLTALRAAMAELAKKGAAAAARRQTVNETLTYTWSRRALRLNRTVDRSGKRLPLIYWNIVWDEPKLQRPCPRGTANPSAAFCK